MTKPTPDPNQDVDQNPDSNLAESAEALNSQLTRRTRRSLLVSTAALAAGAAGYRLLDRSEPIGTLRRPLRAAHDFNAAIAQNLVGETAFAPTYPASRGRKNPTANGPFGIRKDLDPASWRLQLTGLQHPHHHPRFTEDVSAWRYKYAAAFAEAAAKLDGDANESPSIMAGAMMKLEAQDDSDDAEAPANTQDTPAKFLEPIRYEVSGRPQRPHHPAPGLLLDSHYLRNNFPFVEQTTEFKCIEGWSEYITYGGIRFRDFLEAHPPFRNPDGTWPKYAAINTPDGGYYCGFEMEALLHPQTLLCFQMAGRDLTPAHGAPLRLAMPLKYGYKHIKQIGRIHYTNTKPQDYWANLGYDWHGGL